MPTDSDDVVTGLSDAMTRSGHARAFAMFVSVPDLISARGQPFVRRNGSLEVVVFLAWNEAEAFQRRQELLGLGVLAKHQIGLAEMLMGAAMAGIQHQRLLIMADSRA